MEIYRRKQYGPSFQVAPSLVGEIDKYNPKFYVLWKRDKHRGLTRYGSERAMKSGAGEGRVSSRAWDGVEIGKCS